MYTFVKSIQKVYIPLLQIETTKLCRAKTDKIFKCDLGMVPDVAQTLCALERSRSKLSFKQRSG